MLAATAIVFTHSENLCALATRICSRSISPTKGPRDPLDLGQSPMLQRPQTQVSDNADIMTSTTFRPRLNTWSLRHSPQIKIDRANNRQAAAVFFYNLLRPRRWRSVCLDCSENAFASPESTMILLHQRFTSAEMRKPRWILRRAHRSDERNRSLCR